MKKAKGMKKLMSSLAFIALMSLAVLLVGCNSDSKAPSTNEGNQSGGDSASEEKVDPVNLKYATYISAGHYQGTLDQQMIDRIKEQSNGAIEITPYFDGTIMDPKEWYEELLRGTSEVAQAAAGSGVDHFPLEYSVGLFNYGITDIQRLLDFTRELVENTPELQAEFEDVVSLSRLSAGQSWIHTVKKPIHSAADFKGLNLKVADDASVALVKALGANPIKLPISETYGALEKGTIDGVVTGADPLSTFKFAEVVKYSTPLPYATPWLSSKFMSKKVFDSLSAENQQTLLDGFTWWEDQLVAELAKEVQAGIDLTIAEGNEVIELSPEATEEILAVMEENAKKVAADLDAKGLNGTELFENARAIAEQMVD